MKLSDCIEFVKALSRLPCRATGARRFIGAGVAAFLLVGSCTSATSTELEKLKYNHPDLVVDLGVGLWAWPLPCDADGDGDYDLIVSCPDKPSNGIWLFENRTGDTRQDKFPVFDPARRIGPTVHYVLPSYLPEGLRVLSPGYRYNDFLRQGLADPSKLIAPEAIHTARGAAPGGRTNKIRHNQWRYADFDADGRYDLIVGIEDWSDYGWDDAYDANGNWTNGPLHGFVYWLRNDGTAQSPRFVDPQLVHADGRPIDTYGCPTPNLVDFDHDGDLDLLCGEFLDGFTYFENVREPRAEPPTPRFAAGKRLRSSNGQPLRMDLQMIVPIAFDWDRDGDWDLVVGDEDGRVALIENTGELAPDRTPRFLPPRYFQQRSDELKCGALATPVGCDWDGDGDTDIVSGNTAGYIEFFENQSGRGVAEPRFAPPRRLEVDGKVFRVMAGPNGSIQGPCEAKWGYTTFSVADWDLDGLPDVVLNSILGRVVWLRNEGTKHAPQLAAAQAIAVEWPGAPPKPAWTWWQPQRQELVTQWRTTPVVFDFNSDGLPDLAMLDPEGYLAFYQRARRDDRLVLLPPERAFLDAKGQPLRLNERRAGGSGRRKLAVADWDGDGRFDFLVNSRNADWLRQIESAAGTWRFENRGPLCEQNIEGHDVSPTVVDFNANGVVDFLGGAEDGRMYLLKR